MLNPFAGKIKEANKRLDLYLDYSDKQHLQIKKAIDEGDTTLALNLLLAQFVIQDEHIRSARKALSK